MKNKILVLALAVLVLVGFLLFFNKSPDKVLGFTSPLRVPDWHDIYYKRPSFTKGWKFIIIHHSATSWGSAKSFDAYHRQRGFGGLAYHFVIGNGRGAKNGEVQAGFRWKKKMSGTHCTVDAWYHNIFGIGICLVGNFEKRCPTRKQLASLIRLVKKLSRKYKILQENVMGHGDTPHTTIDWDATSMSVNYLRGKQERRVCPGKYFPMNYVIKKVYGKNKKYRSRYRG